MSGTVAEMLLEMRAVHAQRVQYARAIALHRQDARQFADDGWRGPARLHYRWARRLERDLRT